MAFPRTDIYLVSGFYKLNYLFEIFMKLAEHCTGRLNHLASATGPELMGVQDLLGVMANKAGKTRGQLLEMLVRQAETVLSWGPKINGRIGALAARNSMTRAAFLEVLVLKAEGVLTWEPPQLKPKPWWQFWRQPQWEEPSSPLLGHIVEAGSAPKLGSAKSG